MIYLKLFLEFLKIGLFTIGGGYAMIPLVKETVVSEGWMTESRFYDLLGVCESTPGPVAINMATFVGSTQGGILGSLVATLGVVLPSFVIILIIAAIFAKFMNNKYVKYGLQGINGVVIGLIFSTGLILVYNLIGLDTYNSFTLQYEPLIIFPILLLIYFLVTKVFKKNMNALTIIGVSAVLGLLVCVIRDLIIV